MKIDKVIRTLGLTVLAHFVLFWFLIFLSLSFGPWNWPNARFEKSQMLYIFNYAEDPSSTEEPLKEDLDQDSQFDHFIGAGVHCLFLSSWQDQEDTVDTCGVSQTTEQTELTKKGLTKGQSLQDLMGEYPKLNYIFVAKVDGNWRLYVSSQELKVLEITTTGELKPIVDIPDADWKTHETYRQAREQYDRYVPIIEAVSIGLVILFPFHLLIPVVLLVARYFKYVQ
jgi:hypothetical protein